MPSIACLQTRHSGCDDKAKCNCLCHELAKRQPVIVAPSQEMQSQDMKAYFMQLLSSK